MKKFFYESWPEITAWTLGLIFLVLKIIYDTPYPDIVLHKKPWWW